jgi:hypothetical protein
MCLGAASFLVPKKDNNRASDFLEAFSAMLWEYKKKEFMCQGDSGTSSKNIGHFTD